MLITKAAVGPYPKTMFDSMPSVTVEYEDGSTEDLFTFYPDEISFTSDEFIGLTREQAGALRHNKDVEYLQS